MISRLLLTVLLIILARSSAFASSQPIKLSKSGICHDTTSRSYARTKNYTPFDSIEACLKAGGRLTKSKNKQYDEAEREAIARGRQFVTLYNRDEWPHWIDADEDCQNTRHEMLVATSKTPAQFKTSRECNVTLGEWIDPYSGETIYDSKDLDLDHIVPLKFAHGHGGDKWPKERKEAFANDIDNLLLVKASLNRQKGAKSPVEWLPPNHLYRCEYLKRFNAVMAKYGLSFVSSDERIITRMSNNCTK